MFRKVKSVLSALYKYIVWRKCKKAELSIRNIRMVQCYLCEHHNVKEKYISPSFMESTCNICGCYTKLKTWCIDEVCPEGKW